MNGFDGARLRQYRHDRVSIWDGVLGIDEREQEGGRSQSASQRSSKASWSPSSIPCPWTPRLSPPGTGTGSGPVGRKSPDLRRGVTVQRGSGCQ